MKTRKRSCGISVIFAVIAPFFVSVPAQAVTGSTYTNASTVYVVNTFTSAGSTENWTVPAGVTSIDAIAVGGGGGGGSDGANGGGGGELRVVTGQSVTAGDVLAVRVANGGSGNIWSGASATAGGNTDLKNGATTLLQANGGQPGSYWSSGQNTAAGGTGGIGGTGSNGGSGGLNRYQQNVGIGGAGSAGPQTNIPTGILVNYGGGGGGGSCWDTNSLTTAGASGGAGGGGIGAGFTRNSSSSMGSPAGANGTANTGGGAGAGAACDGGVPAQNNVNQRTAGGSGGSGIVVIRYILIAPSTPDLAASSDLGNSNTDNSTSATSLTFTGTAIGGSSIQLFVDGVSNGSPCTANASTGAYSCTTATLSAGIKSITARSSISGATKDSSALSVTIETTAPTASSVSSNKANGSYKVGDVIDIRVTFSEIVNITGTPQITLETGVIDRAVNYSSGSGSNVLVFNYTVQTGDTSTDLDYVATNSLALNGGTISDVPGNSATLTLPNPGAANSLGNSKLLVIDTTAPTIATAALNSSGTSIVLSYSETLSATTAATSAFAVSDSGTAVSVSSVTVSGFTVTLALASTINIGRVVTVSYTDPTGSDDANAIQDSAGNDGISLSSQSVTNNSTAKATPTFSAWSNVSKTFGDGTYTVTAPLVTGSIAGSFSYSSNNTAVISISGSSFTVVGGGSATITATFTPTDSTNYNTATTNNTVTVNRASQSAITITSTAAIYGSNLTLSSSGGSTGGTYIYSKVSGNCTLAGAVLTPTATGICVIQSSLATTANYLAETSTATTITISSGTVGASLTLEPGSLIFRQAKNITAVSTVAGKVTFKVSGKVLPGCKNKLVNAGNSFTTTCIYRPSARSYVTVSATLDPNDSFYVGTVTYSAQYLVTRRTGNR